MKKISFCRIGLRLFSVILVFISLFPVGVLAEYDASKPDLLSGKDLNCTACILIEEESGEVVFEKNADMTMFPASTTKVMTCLVALENCDVKNTTAVVSPVAMFYTPSDSSKLNVNEGEQINLLDLIYGTMLTSGNDGANVIAEAVAGSIDVFVGMMNDKALSLGCTGTHFVNPHGYHDDNHYTTARDLSVIARAAMQNDTFRDIAAATVYTMGATNMNPRRRINIVNNWFRTQNEDHPECYYADGSGIKTGYTGSAGYCYIGSAKNKEGVTLISVVLGCTSRADSFKDTIKLMDYGYSQYIVSSIAEIYMMNPKVIEISGFDTADENVGRLTLNLRKTGSNNDDSIVTTKDQMEAWSANLGNITVTDFTRAFDAPIEKGEVMGTLSYYITPGSDPIVYELIASRSIARREDLAPTVKQIYDMSYDQNTSPFPRLDLEIFLIYIFLPCSILVLLIILLIRLKKKLKHRPKNKVMKPSERYFT